MSKDKKKPKATYVVAWCTRCGGFRSIRVVEGQGTCASCGKVVPV